MKILIVNNMAPFVWGGAEALALHLQNNLIIAGHEAEILRIPFQWEPASRIPSQMLMAKSLELWNVDRVIALKFPAYLLRHPHKTLWLVHQFRQAYDLFDSGQTNLPPGLDGLALRSLIKSADEEGFAECERMFAISENTRQRLQKYNGLNAKVLLPPVNDPGRFSGGEFGDYIFAAGRVNGMKRQKLLLEAMAVADRRVRLLIAGPPDRVEDAELLVARVEELALGDRVRLDLRFLPRDVYASYINNAAAVAYLPYDEDAISYVAMEAATATKAVLTACDSGGILELVKNEETGWVVPPDVGSLARAMGRVFDSPANARIYGYAAHELLRKMKISWPETVDTLLR